MVGKPGPGAAPSKAWCRGSWDYGLQTTLQVGCMTPILLRRPGVEVM